MLRIICTVHNAPLAEEKVLPEMEPANFTFSIVTTNHQAVRYLKIEITSHCRNMFSPNCNVGNKYLTTETISFLFIVFFFFVFDLFCFLCWLQPHFFESFFLRVIFLFITFRSKTRVFDRNN